MLLATYTENKDLQKCAGIYSKFYGPDRKDHGSRPSQHLK